MMFKKKCPGCKSIKTSEVQYADGPEHHYQCGTWETKKNIYPTVECKNNQIAQLTEKLEAWRGLKEVAQALDYGRCKLIIEGPDMEAVEKLRGLGEVE